MCVLPRNYAREQGGKGDETFLRASFLRASFLREQGGKELGVVRPDSRNVRRVETIKLACHIPADSTRAYLFLGAAPLASQQHVPTKQPWPRLLFLSPSCHRKNGARGAAHVNALVAELPADLVNAVQSADDELLEVQLRRDAHVELRWGGS